MVVNKSSWNVWKSWSSGWLITESSHRSRGSECVFTEPPQCCTELSQLLFVSRWTYMNSIGVTSTLGCLFNTTGGTTRADMTMYRHWAVIFPGFDSQISIKDVEYCWQLSVWNARWSCWVPFWCVKEEPLRLLSVVDFPRQGRKTVYNH